MAVARVSVGKPPSPTPDAPHEYVLRHQCPETFKLFQKQIHEVGVKEKFTLRGRTATYRYYYGGDGYKYWIIGRVLNRAKVYELQLEPWP